MIIKLSYDDKYLGRNDNFAIVDTQKDTADKIFDKLKGNYAALITMMMCYENPRIKTHSYEMWNAEIISG